MTATLSDPQASTNQPLRLAGSTGLQSPSVDVAGLPGPKPRWLTGNAGEVKALGLHAAVEKYAAQYGSLFKFQVGPRQILGVADAELIAAILRHRPQAFGRGRALSAIIAETGPTGLFTAEGEQWRRQRRLVMRALTPEHIRRFFPILHAVTARLEAKWRAAAQSREPCDVARDLKCYSVDVATWLSLGEDVNTLEHPENPLQADVEFWFKLVGRRLVSPVPYWRWVKLPADRKAEVVLDRIWTLVAQLIAHTRQRFVAEPARREHPTNILESLVAARDEPGSEFTDDDVAGNVATMLFAGEDTAANAMAWLALHLASNPDALARATAEADSVLGESTVVPAFDDLEPMPYLEAAAFESMRLKPIAPIIGASALVPADLAGLRVEPGQVMVLAQRFASQGSQAFVRSDAFDPTRWLQVAGDAIDDPKRRMFPFGGGPRYCPGRYLAMAELKMVLSMAVRNFRPSIYGDAGQIDEHMTFTMAPSRLCMTFVTR